jgi:hypothetical protein
MRRIVAALGVASAVTLTGGVPAHAIVGDAVPDFEHPYVGLIVLFDAGGQPVQRCTGTLITDEVFLTAGHCLELEEGTPAGSARIWFEQDAGADFDPATGEPASSGFPLSGGVTAGTLVSYGPDESAPPQTYDAGLVILDQPVTDVYPDLTEYAALADPGTLEEYVAADVGGATTTVSGYGLSNDSGDSEESEDSDDSEDSGESAEPADPGSPEELVDLRSRLMARTDVVGLNTEQTGAYNVELAGTQDGEGGGACFGDSGGPLLLPGTDVSIGVISSGTPTCDGSFLSYRTDTEPVLSWILENSGSEADEVDVVDVAIAS